MTAQDGLFAHRGAPVDALRRLDDAFRSWAEDAVEFAFPPLVPVRSLDRCDYFASFPHLGTFAAPVESIEALSAAATSTDLETVDTSLLATPRFMLAPTACYALYDHLAGSVLDETLLATLVSPCFRRETEYAEGTRQWHFTMREIVCVGALDAVEAFLASTTELIRDKLAESGLPCEYIAATDPFFRPDDPKLLLQKLAPVKYEFVDDGGVALSSLNFHRNFFGERFDIELPSGEAAYSGCVGFGIERWLSACVRAFGDDPGGWPEVLRG